jgi:predicted metalloprotease with PDZ domain
VDVRGLHDLLRRLASYRAGFTDAQSFVNDIARTLSAVENNEARHCVSVSDASTSTWIGYDSPVPFGVSYYTQGRNLAALPDLSIRHDTRGALGLDDVMRTLFTDFYQQGPGIQHRGSDSRHQPNHRVVVRRLLQRCITGIEVPPYETIFGYAGYQLERATRTSFDLA